MLQMPDSINAIGVVVVTHGVLATELIGWHDDVSVATTAMSRAIERVDRGRGVLLLTDMFGGTPSNLSMTFLEPDKIEVVTGVNLPMLIKLARLQSKHDLAALARLVCDDGRAAIRVASDLLRGGRTES
jgi:PTS system mannose-specific IIA component